MAALGIATIARADLIIPIEVSSFEVSGTGEVPLGAGYASALADFSVTESLTYDSLGEITIFTPPGPVDPSTTLNFQVDLWLHLDLQISELEDSFHPDLASTLTFPAGPVAVHFAGTGAFYPDPADPNLGIHFNVKPHLVLSNQYDWSAELGLDIGGSSALDMIEIHLTELALGGGKIAKKTTEATKKEEAAKTPVEDLLTGVSANLSGDVFDVSVDPPFGPFSIGGSAGFRLTGVTPEPSSLALLGTGLAALAGIFFRRKR